MTRVTLQNANREHLLNVLAELSEESPQLRFGQLIANLATFARGPEVESIWDAEDGELTEAAEWLLRGYRQRNESEYHTTKFERTLTKPSNANDRD